MRFRRRSIVVDAEQYRDGRPLPAGVEMGPNLMAGIDAALPFVRTPDGSLYVSDGDFIITDGDGNRYPCAAALFDATYEPVEGEVPT